MRADWMVVGCMALLRPVKALLHGRAAADQRQSCCICCDGSLRNKMVIHAVRVGLSREGILTRSDSVKIGQGKGYVYVEYC